ncbi:MAG: hypothetical protein ACTSX6_00160 [Candidatus Heimdallarchaeaceae archaeon]
MENEKINEQFDNEEKLPFPSARVLSIMKKHLSKKHMLSREVKIEVNKFLGSVLEDISKELEKDEEGILYLHNLEKALRKYKTIDLQRKKMEKVMKLLEKQKAEIDEIISEIKLALTYS